MEFPTIHIGLDGKAYNWDEIDLMPELERARYYDRLWDFGEHLPNGLNADLRLKKAEPTRIEFSASIHNVGPQPLFIVLAGKNLYNRLKIRAKETGVVSWISQSFLASGINEGFILEPGQQKHFDLEGVQTSLSDGWESTIDLSRGAHIARFNVTVNRQFHCAFSHLRYENIKALAEKHSVDLWEGNSVSNDCEFTI